MKLRAYLDRLQDTLFSRRDITIEHLEIIWEDNDAFIEAHICFYDASLLVFNEELEAITDRQIRRISYVFHYQNNDNILHFRYDNSPHYPHLATFPSHKHVGNDVIAAEPPDLADVLREIDLILYPRTDDQP